MSSAAIRTLGCRLNQAETAQIASSFTAAGFENLSFEDSCDVYVIHTCTITKNADRKSLQYARSIKKKHPGSIVVLAGCLVEAAGETDFGDIDLCVGQKDKFSIPEILAESHLISGIRHPASSIQHPSFSTTRALIKVQDGCDFCCSYCIVPTARGNPSSRQFTEIIREVRLLPESGYRELVLTGANLGRYSSEGKSLIDLIRTIEEIDGIDRIRLSSIELTTIETDIIELMASSEKICNYLHIPLQSGDDEILKAMGRRYSSEEFKSAVNRAADVLQSPGIGTDVITGFPGETGKHFENTYRLLESLPINNYHVFPYSIRPGTKAADMPGQVSGNIRKARCEELIKLGDGKRADFADSFIGKDVSVLIEKTDGKTASGWTSEYLEAEVESPEAKVNAIITFKPNHASHLKLKT